jgi:hypothetical protein
MSKVEISYIDYPKETNKVLGHGGLLLASVDATGNPNAMTIGWVVSDVNNVHQTSCCY